MKWKTYRKTSSLPNITTVSLTHCTTGHRGQLNTHYHQTTYPSSDHLPIITTIDIRHDYRLHITNIHHIHPSIVSRHLATRGNNKILHTPPPQISSSEEILPRFTRRTLPNSEQINHPSSNHMYTKSTSNHIRHHYAPSVTLTHTSSLPLHPHTHHIRTTLSPLDLWTDPAGVTALLGRWTEKLAGGPQAGASDSPH